MSPEPCYVQRGACNTVSFGGEWMKGYGDRLDGRPSGSKMMKGLGMFFLTVSVN